jgi:hypothetical protein
MDDRKEYDFNVVINGRSLSRVIIDQHYKDKHTEVTDELILSLICEINGENYDIESESNGFQYFTVEPVLYEEKPYRLILLLCIHDDFLGVVNAFRVQRKKYE